MSNRFLRDLLYFDFDKAASLWSQLAGGLREKLSLTVEGQKDKKGGVTLGIPKVFEATFGGTVAEKQSALESKILHHDLLNLLEESLTQLGLVTDLNRTLPPTEESADVIRATIGNRPYVIAEGWSAIEDYQRIYGITTSFKSLTNFVSTCSIQGQPEIQQLLKERDDRQRAFNEETDKHKRNRLNSDIQRISDKLQVAVEKVFRPPEQWLLDGIRLLIDTFMRNRINFRVFPFEKCPPFQLLCNLKCDCFVDQDLEHLLYGYSNRPTVPLSVFGLITSIPKKDSAPFDPMTEFQTASALDDAAIFEKAFRELFGAMEGLEVFVRYSRYPNISVHPIAVFRQFELAPDTKK